MLAVALGLLTAGFTLVYAGVKGKAGDTELWREPWAPYVNWLKPPETIPPGQPGEGLSPNAIGPPSPQWTPPGNITQPPVAGITR